MPSDTHHRLLRLLLSIAIAALVVAAPLGMTCGGRAPEPSVEDGTEVDDAVWYEAGFDFRNRIGRVAGQSHDLAMRFEVSELVQGQPVAYARLILPATGDGEVSSPLPLEIAGFDVDEVESFQTLRPSENPTVAATVPWVITENWPGFQSGQSYSCVPLRRYGPDVSAIVNQIIARPGWGSGPAQTLGLVVRDATPTDLVGDRFVTTQDAQGFGGCVNDHSARLQLFQTVRDTFIGTEILGRITDSSVTVNAVSVLPVDVFFEHWPAPGNEVATPPASYAPEQPIEVVIGGLQPDTRYYYRMHYRRTGDPAWEPGPIHTFHTQRPPESSFRFAVQADSHLQNNLMDNDTESLQLHGLALTNMLADLPDFLIDVGDTFHVEFVQGRDVADFEETRQRYLDQRLFFGELAHSAPLFLALGNHEGEVGWKLDGTPENLAIWGTQARQLYYPNPAPDVFYSGDATSYPFVGQREAYYAFEWGDALFVVLDPYWFTTEKPHSVGGPATGDRWDWTLGTDQYLWLKHTLETSSKRFKLVFAHQVTGGVTDYGRGGIKAARHALGGAGSYEWGGEDADGSFVFPSRRPGWALPVHDLLAANNVAVFFHGHDHVYAREELDHVVYQEVPQPSNASYNKGFPENANNYAAYLIRNSGHLRVSVEPTRLKVEYVRAFLQGDGVNQSIETAYSIYDCNRNGVVDAEENLSCECQNGSDDDGDGLTDFPIDPGCNAAEDLTERSTALPCDDGIDNDGDGAADYPADPGCNTSIDADEIAPGLPCDDGLDGDGDGLVDSADPGCNQPLDGTETDPGLPCDDGLDGDGDGLVDSADPGCNDPLDPDESASALICDNGLDDDGDLLTDVAADPGCSAPEDASEAPDCAAGPDADFDGVPDLCDNCVGAAPNPTQEDADADGVGDLCDNCPTVANADQFDGDADGLGNVCSVEALGSFVGLGNASLVEAGGGRAIAVSGAVLFTLDISDPSQPLPVGGSVLGAPATGMFLELGRVHLATGQGLRTYDAALAQPLGGDSQNAVGIDGGDGLAFTVSGTNKFRAFDVSTPSSPEEIEETGWSGASHMVRVRRVDDRAYVLDTTRGLLVYDVSNPTDAQPLGQLTLPGQMEGIDAVGSTVYVAAGTAGLRVINASNASPALVGSLSSGPGGHAWDVAVDPPFAYVADGTLLLVLDVADPAHPLPIGGLALPGTARSVDVDPDTRFVWVAVDGYGVVSARVVRDMDADGARDIEDNCPFTPNPNQEDADLDGLGDVCDTACANGIDDDADGAADFPADPGCQGATDLAETSAALICDNGRDDDSDGLVDHPADPGCDDSLDPAETSPALVCDNGSDDDSDGLVDHLADPGCDDALDSAETSPALVCDNGSDDDSDGLVDHPADPGCDDSLDPAETSPSLVCDNGSDDDSDGLVDHPADPGCSSLTDPNERLDCSDGIDNDGDGRTDYVAGNASASDPGCMSAADPSERQTGLPCDDGIDNDADGRADFDPITLADAPSYQAGFGDIGCGNPSWSRENPECQDGQHNDGDGLMDWDGGLSVLGPGHPDLTLPDTACDSPAKKREKPKDCGLGFELVLLLAFLGRRRRRGSARSA